MRRRKFLATVGSLAAGSAAAVGTGALSAQSADRMLTGRVAGDAAGFTRIEPGDKHGHFVDTRGNGEIMLNFDENGAGGAGLNPDSLNMFYNVFTIQNWSLEGPLEYYIERNGPNMDRVEFFDAGGGDGQEAWGGDPEKNGAIDPNDYYSITGSPGGTGGGSVIYSKAIGREDSEVYQSGTYKKGTINVDVQIDLRDSGLGAGDSLTDLFGDEDNFKIIAQQPLEEEEDA